MASTLPLKKWYYVLHSTKNSLIFALSMKQQPVKLAKKEIRESIAMKNKNVYAEIKLLFLLFVTFFEFVNPSCCIYQYFLAGKERMRGIGNLQFDQGILVPIFPFGSFLGSCSRAAQEAVPVTHVFKNYEPIIFGMKPLFHNSLILVFLACLATYRQEQG